MISELLVAAMAVASAPTRTTTTRRAFCGGAAAFAIARQPDAAHAAPKDCLQDCLQNCARLAGGSLDYCKESCIDYCAQDDRRDGLSGSVSSEGAEFGWASSFKNPFDKNQKPTVYGDDLPPGLPDAFGINSALRKAVTGGDLTGGVQGQGGARDNSDAAGGLFDSNRFKAK